MFAYTEIVKGSEQVTTLTYDRNPIVIQLPIEVEQQIRFGESVELGIEPILQSKLHIDNVQGTLYIKALQVFPKQRVVAKGLTTGRVVLLDLQADESNLPVRPIFIETATPKTSEVHEDRLTPVELVRFAAQQVYSPNRLVPQNSSVKRVYPRFMNKVLADYPVITLKFLAAWRSGFYIVIAIEVANTANDSVQVNPDRIQGEWTLVGLIHRKLLPANKRGSTTALFLVGNQQTLRTLSD